MNVDPETEKKIVHPFSRTQALAFSRVYSACQHLYCRRDPDPPITVTGIRIQRLKIRLDSCIFIGPACTFLGRVGGIQVRI